MDSRYNGIWNYEALKGYYTVNDERYIAGHSIGIIAVDLKYPKMPGNVVNATTFKFPVRYKKVTFDIHKLFSGDPEIKEIIVNAAKELQSEGVRAVIGACGFFAKYQDAVAEELEIPAFLSSMIQLPMIKIGLKLHQKIGIITATADNIDDTMIEGMGVSPEDCCIEGVEFTKGFVPIIGDLPYVDNELFCNEVVTAAKKMVDGNKDIGAILLECSDMPPYAYQVQEAVGLPVFDFITMINWAHQATTQKPYFGYF